MSDLDCYFMIDSNPDIPEELRTMMVLCIECRELHEPESGWFYRGSEEGYGPFDYVCDKCGKMLHKHEDEK